MVWWRVVKSKLPELAILARSTGRGCIEPNVTVYLIAGHNREVFVGKDCTKFMVNEYVGLVDATGWQPLVQVGREVEMVD